jgi:hypothetical protein
LGLFSFEWVRGFHGLSLPDDGLWSAGLSRAWAADALNW